jgi:protein gp37
MGDNTIIAWTNYTFNPWIGCMEVSPECENCYARVLVSGKMGMRGHWGPATTASRHVTSDSYWRQPFRWAKEATACKERRRVFSGSLCDVFEAHPVADATRPRLWKVIRETPNLDWLLLTKRPLNIADRLPPDWPYRNVWLGTSIGMRQYAFRAQQITRIPAVVHFISAEPLLEDVAPVLDLSDIEWLIVGGESGPGYRPMDVRWARNLKAKCDAAGTAYFYKQSAAPRTEMGIELDGKIVRHYPKPQQL